MRTFFSAQCFQSQRASGYKSTAHALAELIDNSFDANATHVRVLFLEKKRTPGGRYIHEILTIDDGEGMSDDILDGCLEFGETTNKDMDLIIKTKKKGKFGYGLPNASLSQCPQVHVLSRKNDDKYKTIFLDIEQQLKNESIERPELKEIDIKKQYKDIDLNLPGKGGTIVSWRSCDRLSHTRPKTIIDYCLSLHGKIYRYLLNKDKTISYHIFQYNEKQKKFVETYKVEAICNDPLFLMKNTYVSRLLWNEVADEKPCSEHYKKFAISETECEPTNHLVKEYSYPHKFYWNNKEYIFEIKTSYADIDIQKPGIREGGNTKVGQFYAKKKNISFVRSDREISSGTYDFYLETQQNYRWWSIEVHFTPDADDLLGVHYNKQDIEFRYTDAADYDSDEDYDQHTASIQEAKAQLWEQLTNVIQKAYKEVYKNRVQKQASEWEARNAGNDSKGAGKLPSGSKITVTAIKQTDGPRTKPFDDEEKEQLFEILKENYPRIDEIDIKSSIENLNEQRNRSCILYQYADKEALWSVTPIRDFYIVIINTNHPFYSNILSPLRESGAEEAVAAIELFIGSLGYEECKNFKKEEEKDVLERLRALVGIHLKSYIKENSITVQQTFNLRK